MIKSTNIDYLTCCLFFTANSLSRTITEMAKEEFMSTGLDPSYAHLMLLLSDYQGLPQKALAGYLNLKPSSLTRMLEKLESKRLIDRVQVGRTSLIYPTDEGKERLTLIHQALDRLYDRYCHILGEDFAVKLTDDIVKANARFGK